MALFRYPNSSVWWYDFKFNGQRIRETTRSRSKIVAADGERARRRQLEERYNGIAAKQRPQLLSAAVKEYLEVKKGSLSENTLRINGDSLNHHVLPVLGKKLVTDITAQDLKDYQQRRLAKNASPKTINIEVSALRSILVRKKCWEAIRSDFRMLPVPESPGIALDNEEEQLLLAKCKKSKSLSLFYAVLLALCTGMRYSEIRLLCWCQLDLRRGVVTVGKSKTPHGNSRRIPLNKRAVVAMRKWEERFPSHQPDQFVFPFERYGSTGHLFKEWKPKAYGTDPTRPFGSWRKAWATVQRQAGIKCRFHDLRHTACTRMLEGGTPLSVVSALMGWSAANTILMAKRYGHIGQKAFSDAVALLDQAEPKRKHPRIAAKNQNQKKSA